MPDPRDTLAQDTAFQGADLSGRPAQIFRASGRTTAAGPGIAPRWWPTRRNLLNIRGLYNRKTAIAGEEDSRSPADLLAVLPVFDAGLGPLLFPQRK